MTKLHYLCIATLIILALSFLGLTNYHAKLLGNETQLAKAVSTVTAAVTPDKSQDYQGTALEADDRAITENHVVLSIALFIFFVTLLIITQLVGERKKMGERTLQVPLITAAILLMLMVGLWLLRNGASLY